MTYDPDERRETPLASKLKAQIRREGPIQVSRYMASCMLDPEYGYYRTKPAIGTRGDFITAPEISQCFGELVGLWCAIVWQQMGSPSYVNLVETGPGRGTMMADALRAMRLVPGMLDAVRLYLLESNELLIEEQARALAPAGVPFYHFPSIEVLRAAFHKLAGPETIDRPCIIIGNEFLDTVPVEQLIRRDGGWQRRWVGLDTHDRLNFRGPRPHPGLNTATSLPNADLDTRFDAAEIGDIVTAPDYHSVEFALRGLGRLAALFIDYGHVSGEPGDTLQGVRNHRFEHVLTSPGEADLSAQVDFRELARLMTTAGHAVDGPITQAEFLGRLGIVERASRLMSANPAKAAEIEAGVARLLAPNGMGTRFKSIGIRSPSLPVLPGFA